MDKYSAKDKLYIGVCGLVDSGKSTFIKTATQMITGISLPVDSLCNEHEKGITIRMSSILCTYKDIDVVFLDLPGHKEFKSEIQSGLSKSAVVIKIIDSTRKDESLDYLKFIDSELSVFGKRVKSEYVITSKSDKDEVNHYDALSNPEKFVKMVKSILNEILRDSELDKDYFANPEKTALNVIDQAFKLDFIKNPTIMCSFGKDSITLLHLMKKSGHLNKCKVLYLNSGLDMKGISEKFRKNVEDYFGIKVESFKGVPDGWNFDNHSVEDIMKAKVDAINSVISKYDSSVTIIGSRRHEGDGTRAKEKSFSVRDKNGKANLYESALEIFNGGESEHIKQRSNECFNCRVSPILDYTEIDIWKTIDENNLPVCEDYFSHDGLRYRSLGDEETTVPIKSEAKTAKEIIEELKLSKDTERICRAKQDNIGKYNMEKIRSKGFF